MIQIQQSLSWVHTIYQPERAKIEDQLCEARLNLSRHEQAYNFAVKMVSDARQNY